MVNMRDYLNTLLNRAAVALLAYGVVLGLLSLWGQ
jgi:hypothetical protein